MRPKGNVKSSKKKLRTKRDKVTIASGRQFSIPIRPLMPRKYSALDRKRLREYEQKLLKEVKEKG